MTDRVTFGEWAEEDTVAEQQGEAISSVAKFVGKLARAFIGRGGATPEAESPCPDAVPGSVGQTPCEAEAAKLRAKAEAYKAEQMRKRMMRMSHRAA